MGINTAVLEDFSKDKSVEAVKLLLETISTKYNLSGEELFNSITGKPVENNIPLSVFSTEKLSTLEIIVKYFKENLNKKYHEIALIVNRNDRTIWSTYSNSLKKFKGPLFVKESDIVPVSIFSSRKKSVLESLVVYLKDDLRHSYTKISHLLKKDYQTIYTSYRRGISKNEG